MALVDRTRVEAIARRKCRLVTRELVERSLKNGGPVTEYELWVMRKDFERKVRSDIEQQVLEGYE